MDAPLKKTLRALSLELRHTFEGSYTEDGTWNAGDLERRLNQIGIWRDRLGKPISEMPNLSLVDRKARELIDAYLSLRKDAEISQSDAVAEFIRESAYSWANRLFALRCMEARGIIDPIILHEETYGGRSMVHNRFAQRNPSQCTSEDDGFFAMLFEEFREHSRELPDLFAPDSPAVALRPSVAALKKCIALLSGSVPANGGRATNEIFTAPDAFGWAYQYWNAEEKDRVFEMVRTKKGAKIEGSDIIPATQLYTEPYMVKFLVQNSLGATWMMMHPESKLSAAWEYYVKDADRAPADKKSVTEITFLDPACGSGHFLIEAFDLFYSIYEEEGQIREPSSICLSILNNNLFGIDIDERAVQITKAVLWMKAAETVFAKTKKPLIGQGLSEFHDHIIATNIRLPQGKDHLDAFLKKHPEDEPLRPALLMVFEGLKNVHELGSLVQIEEPVEKELKMLKEQAKQQRFDPESGEIVEKVNFSRWKKQVMKRLKSHFQDAAEKALPTETFFSQSAVKGLALFDLLSLRYDIVAANPPFAKSGNLSETLKNYLFQFYSQGKNDLYSAFIMRNLLLGQKKGKIAMVSQHSWLFFRSFTELRYSTRQGSKTNEINSFNGILKQSSIEVIAHLGLHAFTDSGASGSVVALFILSNDEPLEKHEFITIKLTELRTAEEKKELLKNIVDPKRDLYRYISKQNYFLYLPEYPLVYSFNKKFLDYFTQGNKLKDFAQIFEGLGTRKDKAFVRFFWESYNYNRFYPFAKGGGYARWYGLNPHVVEWEYEGKRVKEFNSTLYGGSHWSRQVRNINFYFKPGFSYSKISGGLIGARILDGKWIFSDVAPALICESNPELFAGFCQSHVINFIIRSINPGISMNKGYLDNIPIPFNFQDFEQNNYLIAKKTANLKKIIVCKNIIDSDYLVNERKVDLNAIASFLCLFEWMIESVIIQNYQVDYKELSTIFSETGTPAGFLPLINGYQTLPHLPKDILELPSDVNIFLNEHRIITLTVDELNRIRKRLHLLYEAGPKVKEETSESDAPITDDDNESLAIGARIPIPAETFLEELSQKMEIHPISIYWLLKEGIEKEGWRCIPEEKRYTEDLFTVIVLRLLGHRWPKQIEAGESVPKWADADGVIPITSGLTYPTLLQQVRDRIAAEFPGGKVHEIEKEFEEVVGMSLERWLTGEFFKHHISQFKKRPIAWQLSSSPSGAAGGKGKGKGSRREPAFSCLVYYHKIDADILHKIRTQYVGDLINRYGTELRSLEGRKELTGDQISRKVQLENWIAELKDFAQLLQDVADNGFDSAVIKEIVKNEPLDKWTSRDGKVSHPKSVEEFLALEKRYDPDINDGVRVNIVPLQKAGLLVADVIAKKDVEKAITDRAEWRADERRWCREGKLPKCGWWE